MKKLFFIIVVSVFFLGAKPVYQICKGMNFVHNKCDKYYFCYVDGEKGCEVWKTAKCKHRNKEGRCVLWDLSELTTKQDKK